MKTILLACDLFDEKNPRLTQEWESSESIQNLKNTILGLGYDPVILSNPKEIVHFILDFIERKNRDDLIVWNFVEGYFSRNREGYIPSLCEYLGVCHTGSDGFSQSLTLNKFQTKLLANHLGISTPKFELIGPQNSESKPASLSFPLFAKPNGEGSSLGISETNIIKNEIQFRDRIPSLLEEFGEVLLEEYIEGADLTLGVIGNHPNYEVTPIARVEYPGAVYSEEVKTKDGMPETLVFDVSEEIFRQAEKKSIHLAEIIRFSGYARIDFILKEDRLYFLEINLTPGFSNIYSSLPEVWEKSGKKYSDLIRSVLDLAEKEYKSHPRYRYGKENLSL
ncbi:D-alanine--D-alanine ligase family protein [Leptospira idonii]|uniref:D-alanine--D-alanine ligase n=1 Tax=Leptospira idonii TaxID=1193500 RepID=A0A4R9LY70_9LEPT|nr:D-alanine--D-alanine ligase [Leptospira idonii]TGN18652.1 D-alanine--D-alanine ligase [Leptospira idonii]